jgi:transmembrane sensor
MVDDTDLRALSLGAQPERREGLKATIRARAAQELYRRRFPTVGGRGETRFRRLSSNWRHSLLLMIPLAAAALFLMVWVPVGDAVRERSGAITARKYTTGAGERMELTLEDGTLVVLGAASRLRVPGGWSMEKREVHLEGIGYFDVVHTQDRPFIVHADGVTTRVLGTRFVVRAYPREGEIGVAVASGRVAVSADSIAETPAIVLNGGQVGQLRTSDGLFEINQDVSELNRLLEWARGPLRFTDRPLAEVFEKLEYWYQIEFVVTDSALAQQPLSIRVQGERFDDVIEAIALALNARYERIGDTVSLTPR